MKRIFSLFALMAVFALTAFADIRPPITPKPTPSPKEQKAVETDFRVSIRKDAKEARLLIPKDQLKALRAQLDELDGGASPTAAAFLSFSRAQTVVGGLFLSLAAVFGGVWFSRRRSLAFKPNKAVVAGAVLVCGGALTVASYANMGPPMEARSITGRIFTPAVHMYKQAWGKVKVEATDNDEIELVVPDVPDDKKAAE